VKRSYQRMLAPHNTGKVQIGRAYVSPPMRIEGEALYVQRALLDTHGLPPAHPLAKLIAPIWRWL